MVSRPLHSQGPRHPAVPLSLSLDDIPATTSSELVIIKNSLGALTLLVVSAPVLAQDRATAVPDMKVLLENECVRMQFHDVAVGEKTPMHSHPKYAVYVFNPYKARITLANGMQVISEHKAGESFWKEASQHVVENIGTTPIHNLVLELKPGPGCH